MANFKLTLTIIRELLTSENSPRINEPDLVMDGPESVAAYVEAGREHAVMAPVYLYHCANICEVIRPGDTVVDLACGPANQLAMVARLNPNTQFIGIDLSLAMLEEAQQLILKQGLKNVTFRQCDITNLYMFADKSIDAVISTMALHHLPDNCMLTKTYSEVGRILKSDGGIYMVDFGHLKSNKSIDYFAYQYADRQPKPFTIDYYNSLHAAFHVKDFEQASRQLNGRAKLYSTFAIPFLVALKSRARRGKDDEIVSELSSMRKALPKWHQADYNDMIKHFKMKGLKCSLIR